MSQAEASRIVAYLIRRGFSQTEIARGLGLGAKGSGSYVGQIIKGVKGAQKVGELRQLEAAAKGRRVTSGRSASAKEARQRILDAAGVQRQPRQKKAGGTAAVRKAATKVTVTEKGGVRRGYVQAFAGQQSLNGPTGGGPIEAAIRGMAARNGRVALTVVGRFNRDSPAHRSSYWTKFYGKKKKKPGRQKGSSNLLEAHFGGGGRGSDRGMSAREWASKIDVSGTFLGALREHMEANGYDMPDAWVRAEVMAWTE